MCIPDDLSRIPGAKPSADGGESYLIVCEDFEPPLAVGILPPEMTVHIKDFIDPWFLRMIEFNGF